MHPIYSNQWSHYQLNQQQMYQAYLASLAAQQVLSGLPQVGFRSPAQRITEIEHELDIIKGRVPTPKGYTITPARAKALIRELHELRAAA